jgi:hypothetical protein
MSGNLLSGIPRVAGDLRRRQSQVVDHRFGLGSVLAAGFGVGAPLETPADVLVDARTVAVAEHLQRRRVPALDCRLDIVAAALIDQVAALEDANEMWPFSSASIGGNTLFSGSNELSRNSSS